MLSNASIVNNCILSYDVASGSEITPYTSGLQIFGKRYEITPLTSRIMAKS